MTTHLLGKRLLLPLERRFLMQLKKKLGSITSKRLLRMFVLLLRSKQRQRWLVIQLPSISLTKSSLRGHGIKIDSRSLLQNGLLLAISHLMKWTSLNYVRCWCTPIILPLHSRYSTKMLSGIGLWRWVRLLLKLCNKCSRYILLVVIFNVPKV